MSGRIDLTNNDGPLVNIAGWFSLAAAILATGGKVYTKWTMMKELDWNDAAIVTAMLTSVAMIVATSQQVNSGLGRDEGTLSSSQIDRFYLTTYVSSLFYVLTVFVTKLTCLHFFLCLVHQQLRQRIVKGLIIFVGVWITVSIFVQSFQCSLPNIWYLERKSGTCIQEVAFWTVHGIMDILTQLFVSFLPVYLLHDIHTSFKRKILVMLSFSPNALTIPLIILRLVYLRGLYSSSNPTRNSWELFLISVLHANVAIIVCAIPFAKPILDSFSIGVITNDVRHGLAWDQSNYVATVRGNKYGSSSRSGGSASKIFLGFRKGSSNGKFSSGQSNSGSSASKPGDIELAHGLKPFESSRGREDAR